MADKTVKKNKTLNEFKNSKTTRDRGVASTDLLGIFYFGFVNSRSFSMFSTAFFNLRFIHPRFPSLFPAWELTEVFFYLLQLDLEPLEFPLVR